jgi:DNA-binding NarL/FixJ family response regulator
VTANRIRVGIAIGTAVVKEALGRLLKGEPGVEVVGLAATPAEALRLAQAAGPDVLLLELGLQPEPLEELLSALATARPSLKVLLVSAGRPGPAPTEAALLGAWGVVRLEAPLQELLKAIETVASGQHWVARDAVAGIVGGLRRRRTDVEGLGPLAGLSRREREVALAVAEGESNREVAEKLSLAEDTVKHHISNIFDKVGVSNRAELAAYAAGHGLTDPPTPGRAKA